MKDYKFWVNAYSEESGEYSNGWTDYEKAYEDYCNQLLKMKKENGYVEFLEVKVLSSKGYE